MSRLIISFALILILILLLFFGYGGGEYLTFSAIKSAQQTLFGIVTDAPALSFFGFAVIYIIVTALSLPGAGVLTLLAGGLFGLWQGLILVSFAASIGATLAMLAARFLFRDLIAAKFSEAMALVNAGMKADGARYLLTLRLVPVVPFFVINLVMGLTNLSARRFYWVSQLGMLPGTLIFVNAGKQLADLQSPAGILSPELLVSLLLLALLPWLMKAVMHRVEQCKQAFKNIDAHSVVGYIEGEFIELQVGLALPFGIVHRGLDAGRLFRQRLQGLPGRGIRRIKRLRHWWAPKLR